MTSGFKMTTLFCVAKFPKFESIAIFDRRNGRGAGRRSTACVVLRLLSPRSTAAAHGFTFFIADPSLSIATARQAGEYHGLWDTIAAEIM
jgi:hypothetical protein